MKRKMFFLSIALFAGAVFFSSKTQAKVDEPAKQILAIDCYDSQGQASGIGNTCQKGSGHCIANGCNN